MGHPPTSFIAGPGHISSHRGRAWSSRVIEDFKVRLGKVALFKNCFQIPVDWEIDRELMKDLVRARLAELD
jgi:hypothetical protein